LYKVVANLLNDVIAGDGSSGLIMRYDVLPPLVPAAESNNLTLYRSPAGFSRSSSSYSSRPVQSQFVWVVIERSTKTQFSS
jgi:hypothetical protein